MFQFIKFCLVGVSNTFISFAVYYLFYWINPALYLIGNAVGFAVSVLNAYYWSGKYVFTDGNGKLHRTYIVYGATFVLSMLLMFCMVNYLGVSKIIVPIINLLFTIPLNFVLNKFWAFNASQK